MAKDQNTGSWNTGNYNTGDRNTGSWNTGDLNTNSPTVRLFNNDSGWEFNSDSHRQLRETIWRYQRALCEWVYEANMTEK